MSKSITQTFVAALLLAAVVGVQLEYDRTKSASGEGLPNTLSPEAIRMLDMGFNSTVASFMWVATMPEILDLFIQKYEYLSDRAFLSQVDPKLTYPYAFSVLTLPVVPHFPDALSDAQAIGQEGLANGDPDWRIPYYMALNYDLGLKDQKNALIYFNIAAETPGIPYFAKRFAENFGADQKDRDVTMELWETIRDTTNDPDTKARAQAYIDRLDIFDYLDDAVAQYKKTYGVAPTSLNQLVQKNIIPAIPQDPFGYTFVIQSDGTVNVDTLSNNSPAVD